MNLLIIKHGALGDVVRTSYFLPGLIRKHGADTCIFWLTTPAAVDLLRHHPQVYRIATHPSELADTTFDCIISLDDETSAASATSQLKHRRLIGAYMQSGKLVYTPDSAAWFDMGLISRHGKPEADRRKKANHRSHAAIFSEILGITIDKGSFYNTPLIEQRWQQRVDSESFRIGINPFAGNRWPAKALRMEEIRKLVPALLDYEVAGRSVKIYFFAEGEVRQRLEEFAGEFSQRVEVLKTSDSVLDFAAAIKATNYLITSDSLGLHLAIAQGVPNLSFYAPTSAAEIDTFGTGIKVCSTSPDYCSYRKDADNSSITADLLVHTARTHIGAFRSEREPVDREQLLCGYIDSGK
jgi:ADP-heptose:LPS heptosyltransferase